MLSDKHETENSSYNVKYVKPYSTHGPSCSTENYEQKEEHGYLNETCPEYDWVKLILKQKLVMIDSLTSTISALYVVSKYLNSLCISSTDGINDMTGYNFN